MRNFRVLVLSVFLLLPHLAFAANWQWISRQRVHRLLKEGSGVWIVDVRSPAVFEQGHIESAVNIPIDVLNLKNPPKSKTIVLADDTLGLRNARAGADMLLNKGYEKIFVLEGGIPAWLGERLAHTGKDAGVLLPVQMEDLVWARSKSIPVKILDIRDKQEQLKAPVEGARSISGDTISVRLKTIKDELVALPGKKLAIKLEKKQPVILVLPNSHSALEAAGKTLRGVAGDFRYLDGAYPLWAAREKTKPLIAPQACLTCTAPRGEK